jgi:cytochrome c5
MSAQPTSHDPEDRASFIKTPRQLVTILVLSFLVPVVLIILLAKVIVSMRAPDPAVLAPEAVAARIKPVADIAIQAGGTASAPGTNTGEEVYKSACTVCHQTGVANAPKFGDKAAWAKLIVEGLERLSIDAIKGVRGMPPRGGNPNLSDAEVTRAIVYMANAADANWKEP